MLFTNEEVTWDLSKVTDQWGELLGSTLGLLTPGNWFFPLYPTVIPWSQLPCNHFTPNTMLIAFPSFVIMIIRINDIFCVVFFQKHSLLPRCRSFHHTVIIFCPLVLKFKPHLIGNWKNKAGRKPQSVVIWWSACLVGRPLAEKMSYRLGLPYNNSQLEPTSLLEVNGIWGVWSWLFCWSF